MMIAENV